MAVGSCSGLSNPKATAKPTAHVTQISSKRTPNQRVLGWLWVVYGNAPKPTELNQPAAIPPPNQSQSATLVAGKRLLIRRGGGRVKITDCSKSTPFKARIKLQNLKQTAINLQKDQERGPKVGLWPKRWSQKVLRSNTHFAPTNQKQFTLVVPL